MPDALMPYQDYAPSGFSQFVTGMNEGWKNMQDRMKQYYELKNQQLAYEAADATAAAKKNARGGDSGVTTTTEPGMNTGAGGAGGSSGGSGGSAGAAEGLGRYAQPVVDYFKSIGWSPEAIQGVMANGQAEGRFDTPWKEGDGGTSFGHWQFHYGGEMGGYRDWLKNNNLNPNNDADLQSSVNQAKYVAYRMNQIDPNYGQIGDARQATDLVQQQFERPRADLNQTGARYSYLPGVQKGLDAMQPPTAAPVGSPQLAAAAPDYNRAMQTPIPSAASLGTPSAAIGTPPAPAPAPAAAAAPPPKPQAAYYPPPPAFGGATPAAYTPPGSYAPTAQSNFAFNGQPPVFQPGVGQGNPPTMALGGPGGPQMAVQQPPPGQPDVWNQPQQPQQQYALVPVNSGLWTG